MMKSMTGFGRGEFQEQGKSFSVEIKTVNHRYMDVFVKYPRSLSFLEEKVRAQVSKSISRGKIDVYINYEDLGEDAKTVVVDETLVAAYLVALNTLRDKYGLIDDVSVSQISRYPDVLRIEKVEDDEGELLKMLSYAVEKALDSLQQMRTVEGQALKSSLYEKLDLIEKIRTEIEQRSPKLVLEYKDKLNSKIKDLMDYQVVDESRLATEIAIFADKCSTDEEVVRLKSHIIQFKENMEIDLPVGRKLDFLVQEMNREINTIGSKANDLAITNYVVDVKSELEKIREQVQNIE